MGVRLVVHGEIHFSGESRSSYEPGKTQAQERENPDSGIQGPSSICPRLVRAYFLATKDL